QAAVAGAQAPFLQAGGGKGLGDQCDGVGLRLLARGAAKRLDAGLAELARVRRVGVLRLKAESGAAVAVFRRLRAAGVTLKVEAARRYGEVGAQAQLVAVRIGEDVGAG